MGEFHLALRAITKNVPLSLSTCQNLGGRGCTFTGEGWSSTHRVNRTIIAPLGVRQGLHVKSGEPCLPFDDILRFQQAPGLLRVKQEIRNEGWPGTMGNYGKTEGWPGTKGTLLHGKPGPGTEGIQTPRYPGIEDSSIHRTWPIINQPVRLPFEDSAR